MALPKPTENKYEKFAIEATVNYVNDHPEYGRSYGVEDDGERVYLKPGRNLGKELAKGNVYKFDLYRKVGAKNWNIDSAVLVAGEEVTEKVKPEVGQTTAPVKTQVDSGQKSKDIRWMACLKAAAVISKSAGELIENAHVLYNSSPDTKVTIPTTTEDEKI